ncbi:MAG: hypothetical protein NTV69_14345 [Caldilinea sp.]|nr:hypothetical protein [Caldilinea sp.]
MSFSGPAASSPRNRTALVLTTSLLVAFFVLIGVGWLFFVFQDGQLGGATPTATPTPLAATRTPTPRQKPSWQNPPSRQTPSRQKPRPQCSCR